jgi:DNA polymerase III alpha subunit
MADLQKDDPAVYAMIQKADTLGTFQIESRAQMSMLPRIKPAKFYDLVIEVAIVRPGRSRATWFIPICAAKARRRRNIPSPSCAPCWKRRWACPLQEQAMKVAIVGAGFTPAEADQLRRAMATFQDDRRGQPFLRQAGRRHGGARLQSGLSPSAPSSRSRASAAMAFPRAMPPASPRSPMQAAG